MRLYLEVIDGPDKGEKFSLNAKTTVGRKGADIILNDVKLSGIHAYFEYSPESGWSIVDHQSRNGVWVNGLKELKMVLKDSDVIQLGGSQLVCRMQEAGAYRFSDKFQVWMQSLYKKVVNSAVNLKEIKPEIRLKVIQGVQYGETWTVFYGPRQAGRESTDICLFDEEAPRHSFEIRVKGKYAYFYTENEAKVKLNDQNVTEKQFTPGDVISFGDTRILVEVDNGHGFSD